MIKDGRGKKPKGLRVYVDFFKSFSYWTFSIISLRMNIERDVFSCTFPSTFIDYVRPVFYFALSPSITVKMILCNKKRKNHEKSFGRKSYLQMLPSRKLRIEESKLCGSQSVLSLLVCRVN